MNKKLSDFLRSINEPFEDAEDCAIRLLSKHYGNFRSYYRASVFLSEQFDSTEENWPDSAYAYREVTLRNGVRNMSEGRFYRADICQVEERNNLRPQATTILMENMDINGWTHIVWTPQGALPFYPERDKLV